MQSITKQNKTEIPISAVHRDLIHANWNYMEKNSQCRLGEPALYLDHALEWYLKECVSNDVIIVPIYDISQIKLSRDERMLPDRNFKKIVKCMDDLKILKIKELWSRVPEFNFQEDEESVFLGRGSRTAKYINDESIIFSVWLYCYENGGFPLNDHFIFKKFGSTMKFGYYYTPRQELIYNCRTGAKLMLFDCSLYFIDDGNCEGNPPSGLSRMKELSHEREASKDSQNFDDNEVEFDYREIGD